MPVGSKALEALQKRYEASLRRNRTTREEGNAQVMEVVATVETTGSAFGHGMIEGYWDGVEFIGIPFPLVTGTVFHALGFAGFFPEHMHNVGNGAFCAYGTTLGLGIGEEMRRKNAQPAQPAGVLPPAAASGGQDDILSDAELAAIAQHA